MGSRNQAMRISLQLKFSVYVEKKKKNGEDNIALNPWNHLPIKLAATSTVVFLYKCNGLFVRLCVNAFTTEPYDSQTLWQDSFKMQDTIQLFEVM